MKRLTPLTYSCVIFYLKMVVVFHLIIIIIITIIIIMLNYNELYLKTIHKSTGHNYSEYLCSYNNKKP